MERIPIVLFVNHLQSNCGVYQFFKRLTAPIVAHREQYYYIETNEEWEFDYWRDKLNPDIVVYNFYFSGITMPWLSDYKIAVQRNRFKQIGLHHEGNMDGKRFDLILHQDPTNIDSRYYTLSRPIPEYTAQEVYKNTKPTIGTFGFGLGGKGFTRVVNTVISEFEAATIYMNIPYAHFGDKDGIGARQWAEACYRLAADYPLIDIHITHDLLPESQLLDFLYRNDINCFLYDDNKGRGISGTTDYALAVRKPIAITHSDQFRHLWIEEPRILIENNTLIHLINNGGEYLQKFHDKWNKQQLITDFEQAFERVMNV